MKNYDVAFIGHMCYDQIVPFEGEAHIAPGSAVLCGAMAAAAVGKSVAVVTRLAAKDDHICDPMRQAGIDVLAVHSEQTTFSRVIHPTADVDVREMILVRDSGPFRLAELPELSASRVHLAGISDREFPLQFVRDLNAAGYSLSADMQSFVRQVDPETREIRFADVADKREIVSLLDRVKLDVVEAKLLTGTDDLSKAAAQIASWGASEVVITQGQGVLARVDGQEYYEPFSNRSIIGRTGRGDTTFAAYLCRRLDHGPAQSLRFAAALVSLKMETPGPFGGTLEEVLHRMGTCHCR